MEFFLGGVLGFAIASLVAYAACKRFLAFAMRDVSLAFEMMGEAFDRVLVECQRIKEPTPAMQAAIDHAVETLCTLQKAAGIEDVPSAQEEQAR